jgi:hypothetical protein
LAHRKRGKCIMNPANFTQSSAIASCLILLYYITWLSQSCLSYAIPAQSWCNSQSGHLF